MDAYPESVRRGDGYGSLPSHYACGNGRLDTVEYLFRLYPESLHIRDIKGYLPIHCAASIPGDNTAEIIKFLLRHDPECISKPVFPMNPNGSRYNNGRLPLHLVCLHRCVDEYNVTEFLFDLYPEAILIRDGDQRLPFDVLRSRDDRLSLDPNTGKPFDEELRRRNRELLAFLSVQMNYARKAQDRNYMRTPDSNGSLPLHNALRAKAPLGSIKLLVKGYPNGVNVPDGSGMLPLDIACEVSTVGVVKYLTQLLPDCLNACDVNRNFPLHYACRGGNCEVISYLLETPVSSALVSERNAYDMLPIHLFCEVVNEQEENEDTPEYTETIWRLLTAYPETVLNW